jgi:hypothetical protein
MTMYGADAVNEVLWMPLDVQPTASSLPGMEVVNAGSQGFQNQYPAGLKQGTAWSPGHALIIVETGTVRIRMDGIDPDSNNGTLYGVGTPAGPVIDWTDVTADFHAMINNCRVVRADAATASRLAISYRN